MSSVTPGDMEKNPCYKYEFHTGSDRKEEQFSCPMMCRKYWMCFAFFFFIAIIIFVTQLVTLMYHEPTQELEFSGDNLTIITRTEWNAKPNMEEPVPLRLPVKYVVILHTATQTCLTEDNCKSRVRLIQDYHMTHLKHEDIGYSFLVAGDGNVYEGRGWDVRGAFAPGYNSYSIGVAFIGDFRNVLPTETQMQDCQQLIQRGLMLGKIAPNYKLLGHRQISQTESPGDTLYEIMKTWPHWGETE